MTHDILIRTYYKDVDWLTYCLQSLLKHASGFRRIIIITPSGSMTAIKPLADKYEFKYMVCDVFNEDDYVGQMGTKMFYDTLTDADVIHHVDADMIFSQPYSPSPMINRDGKVIIGKQEYHQLQICWKPITERLVGFEVTWEYNRIFPSAYPRWLYEETRKHLEKTHGKTMKDILNEVKAREFSECNVLGAVGEKFFADKLDFRDITRDELPPRPCACYWSWGGITPEIKARIDKAIS